MVAIGEEVVAPNEDEVSFIDEVESVGRAVELSVGIPIVTALRRFDLETVLSLSLPSPTFSLTDNL